MRAQKAAKEKKRSAERLEEKIMGIDCSGIMALQELQKHICSRVAPLKHLYEVIGEGIQPSKEATGDNECDRRAVMYELMSEVELRAEVTARKWPSAVSKPGPALPIPDTRSVLSSWDSTCRGSFSSCGLLVEKQRSVHGPNSDSDTETDTDTDTDNDADRDADHSAGYGDHKADSESEGGAEHDKGAPLLEMEEEQEPAEEPGYKAILQGLGKGELQEVFEAWRQPRGNHSTNVVAEVPAAIEGTAVSLLGKHMYRMNPKNKLNEDKWLFDETINAYMWLLQMRDYESVLLAQDAGMVKKPSLYFNSFFFEKLHSGIEPHRRYNYSAVERFAR
jgi:hypothetical protein